MNRHLLLAFFILLFACKGAFAFEARVIDAMTQQPITSATITAGDNVATTDGLGAFKLDVAGGSIGARAPGYRAVTVSTSEALAGQATIKLAPFLPKALYLSFYGIGNKTLRESALNLIRDSKLNALVIDIKGDRGLVSFPTSIPLATASGATRITTIPDLPKLIAELKGQGIYTIARIVVFKDDPLATSRNDLAIKAKSGELFRDREGLAWTDPFSTEVRDYNISLAVEAARAGFEEIQFDYVRFPDDTNVSFSRRSTEATRMKAITDFLGEARRQLAPFNVYLAADVFGYVCWNTDDMQIGQRLEEMLPLLDYISPMLYPSGFQFGIPGFRDPVEHPYEIVRYSLDRALARTGASPLRFRPWLQAFRDYAFDRRVFDADDVAVQIKGAESFGTDGWMLWNPRNIYTDTGF